MYYFRKSPFFCYNRVMNITDRRKLQTRYDYSVISPLYEADFGHDFTHFELIDNLIQAISKNEKLASLPIIDLGSGPGVVIDYLLQKGIRHPIAVDLTEEFCKMIREKHGTDVEVVCEDMVDFLKTVKGSSVAAYTANYSIIHIPDEEVDPLFRNIHESLAEDGLFLMSCHQGGLKGMEQEPYQTQKDPRLNIPATLVSYMNYFTEDELKSRIQKAGFKILEMHTFKTKPAPGEIPVPKIWILAKKSNNQT